MIDSRVSVCRLVPSHGHGVNSGVAERKSVFGKVCVMCVSCLIWQMAGCHGRQPLTTHYRPRRRPGRRWINHDLENSEWSLGVPPVARSCRYFRSPPQITSAAVFRSASVTTMLRRQLEHPRLMSVLSFITVPIIRLTSKRPGCRRLWRRTSAAPCPPRLNLCAARQALRTHPLYRAPWRQPPRPQRRSSASLFFHISSPPPPPKYRRWIG